MDILREDHFIWTLFALGAIVLVSLAPAVHWTFTTPGYARRYWTLFHVLMLGAVCLTARLRLWPIVIGGVGLVWLTSAAANAANLGG